MDKANIQKLRDLAEIAANGDGHRPQPCPICDLAELAQEAVKELEKEEVWVSLHFDFSGFALFTDELEARRYADEHNMSVHPVKFGKDVCQQVLGRG